MPRFTKDGRCILPASEVGEFTVCPKAWALKHMENKATLGNSDVDDGFTRHQSWAEDLEFGFTLGRLIRLVMALISCATMYVLLLAERL
jgi:hypothetical protein